MKDLNKFEIWKLAIRPKTLPAAISPVVVGVAFAFKIDNFSFFPAFAAFLGALLLQIAANLANDYYDFKKGTDTEERIGPARVTATGLLTENELLRGLIITIFLSIIVGIYLIWVAGYIILFIGISSIIALLAYSGLTISYGYRGLGDIFVFIFFGLFAVNGTYYVQTEEFEGKVLLGSIPSGLLITAILVVNNYRDLETDAETGKKTLAVMMGSKLTRYYFIFLLLGSYFSIVAIFLIYNLQLAILLPFLTIPISIKLVKSLYLEIDGKRLNQTLANTAKLGLIFNILFSIGIMI